MTSTNDQKKNFIEKCIIAYPHNNIKSILKFNGIVRYLNEKNKGKLIIIVSEQFEKLFKHLYSDINDIEFHVVEELTIGSLTKVMLQNFKNYKQRQLFGFFDKFRFDEYKNVCKVYNEETINPYLMYDFDENLLYHDFIVPTIKETGDIILKNIRKFVNLDFHLYSDDVDIPIENRKNGTIGIIIPKMFNNNTFLNSTLLISKAKGIHLFDNHYFSVFVGMIKKSKSLSHILQGKKIFFYHKKRIPDQVNVPRDWTLVKI